MKKHIDLDATSFQGFNSDLYKKEFEDFCDFRFVDRLSDEELMDFVREGFKHRFSGLRDIKFIEVDPESWLDCDDVIINKEDRDYTFIIYSVKLRRAEEPDEDDEFYRFYKPQPPEVEVRYLSERVDEFFEWNLKDAKCAIRLRECDSAEESIYFSDFTLRKNKDFGMLSWPTWVVDPDYLVFMIRKFGLEYTNQLFNTRKAYRAYYITKERALKSECMRLMEENQHPILGLKDRLVKTTERFIDSITEDVLRAFHYWYQWEPYIIDVTNFQSLKNEDISPENKDSCGRTILRRFKYGRDEKGLYSIEEWQARQELTQRNSNGEYVKYYPKKNPPVNQRKKYFGDFVFNDGYINENILLSNSVERIKYGEWTGIMYSAFGEPYRIAFEGTFDDRLQKWVRNFDGTTGVLIKFIDGIGENAIKLVEESEINHL